MSRDSATPGANLADTPGGERQSHQVRIEEMTLGPYGIGHLQGKALMVPNCAPGDLLSVAIVQSNRDYSLGRLQSVDAGGPARRPPPCVFLPRCGGCDWQQIDYPQQVAAKGRLIAAELKRVLGLDLDPRGLVAPAPKEFGYRSRLRFKVDRNGALGFFEAGSNRLVHIDRCLVADENLSFAPAVLIGRALKGRCEE